MFFNVRTNSQNCVIMVNVLTFRYEETNMMSLECKKKANDICIGGYARIVATVKQLQRSRTNPIYFNAGDNFAGTMWFTFGKWNVTSYFLNLLKADIMVRMRSTELCELRAE